MAVIWWKWSENSLIKVRALLSITTLVFVRSNLVFHAYVFFSIQILMIFEPIPYPTYFWSIALGCVIACASNALMKAEKFMNFIIEFHFRKLFCRGCKGNFKKRLLTWFICKVEKNWRRTLLQSRKLVLNT